MAALLNPHKKRIPKAGFGGFIKGGASGAAAGSIGGPWGALAGFIGGGVAGAIEEGRIKKGLDPSLGASIFMGTPGKSPFEEERQLILDEKLTNLKREEQRQEELFGAADVYSPPTFKHGTKSYAKHGLSSAKARTILRDGKVRGKELTDKQKGFFGLIAGGGTPTRVKFGAEIDAEERVEGLENGGIEVEKDEQVFQRTPSGKFILVDDFKDAAKHQDGGGLFFPKEGDIIYPGYSRRKIKNFMANKNFAGMDAERLKLPELGGTEARHGMKAQFGADETEFTTPYTELMPLQSGFVPTTQYNQELAITPEPFETRQPIPQFPTTQFEQQPIDVPVPTGATGAFAARPPESTGFDVGGAATTAAQLAPILRNIVKGAQPAETYAPIVNPYERDILEKMDRLTYDITPELEEIERGEKVAVEKARNLSGGNTAVLMSNISNIRAQTQRLKDQFSTKKQNVEAQYDVFGARFMERLGRGRVRGEELSQGLGIQAQLSKDIISGAAFTQASELAQRKERQRQQEKVDAQRQQILDSLLQIVAGQTS